MVYLDSGDTVAVTATAADPDNDPLTYTWSASGGRVDGTGPQVRWLSAGTAAGSYTVTVQVDDGRGGSASLHRGHPRGTQTESSADDYLLGESLIGLRGRALPNHHERKRSRRRPAHVHVASECRPDRGQRSCSGLRHDRSIARHLQRHHPSRRRSWRRRGRFGDGRR